MSRPFVAAAWFGIMAAAFVPGLAFAREGDLALGAEAGLARDVVPPDEVEASVVQDRFADMIFGNASLDYDTGPVLLGFDAGVESYPGDSRLDRYSIGAGARTDVPVAAAGRIRLRLGTQYQYVAGNDGRVFDRLRAEVQLIHRASASHRTVARLRYGFRNQSEARFEGFDQNEWLAELGHTWRPDGGATRLTATVLGLRHDADHDRFSYDGFGLRLTGRFPLGEGIEGQARLGAVRRVYEGDFSEALPIARKDTRLDVSAGLSMAITGGAALFGEAGYADNRSNIAPRDFNGATARFGLRWRFRSQRGE